MSEKELGRALLNLDAQQLSGLPEVREQTWRILERDRRRVWWLTALTIALWGAAIVMVLWMLVAMALLMPLEAHLRNDAEVARSGMSPQMRADAEFKAHVMFRMVTVGVTCSVGLLGLAALATVFVVIAGRRATLRQINASLVEITQQLKELKQAGPPK